MTSDLVLVRQASRLLLIDDDGGVLLFKYEDDRGTWWAMPGGGLEESESFEEAARREAKEELGLTDFSIEQLWEGTAEFQSRGKTIRQTERYFLVAARSGSAVLGEDVRDAHALEGILAVRWWPPSEISSTTERVFPEDLPARLRDIRERDGGSKHRVTP